MEYTSELSEILEDFDRFMSETEATADQGLKALDRLRSGISVDVLIESYHKFLEKEKVKPSTDRDICTLMDCDEELIYDLKNGLEKGTSTYVTGLDNYWTWRLGEVNIWTGYANEGKSLFLRYITLIKCLKDNYKAAFYAPEDYPAKEFYADIIHTAAGRSLDKTNPNFIGLENYYYVRDILKDYFFFVYKRPPENDILSILESFIYLIENNGVNVCVLDPVLKISRPKEYADRDDRFAAYVTTLLMDFSRRYKVSVHVVMHQGTPRAQENGLYPKPSMYFIKGGGSWADGVDNVISLQRPFYASDKLNPEIVFISQKIKKQKLVGIPGEFKMSFDRRTNRYMNYENIYLGLFDFESILTIKPPGQLFN